MVMLIAKECAAFDDPDYLYELKLDGTRCLAYLDQDTQLYNKRRFALSYKFPELSQLHTYVKRRCILDGELYVYQHQRVDFFASQRRSLLNDPFKIRMAAAKFPACFTAFDIVYDEDQWVNEEPLWQRKERLADIIIKQDDRFNLARYIMKDGIALFELTQKLGLEGIVAKHKESRYQFGKRTSDWVKCKNWMEDDFVICGYIEKEHNVVSLVLGQYDQDILLYQGHVTMGAIKALAQFKTLPHGPCPFLTIPKGNEHAVWFVPKLVGIVSYMERTPQGGLRQPVLRGIRNDKEASECRFTGN
ncbi:MAG: DNA ligase [Erysipelotrichaceae bacterium]|nr:DNA ligase [Erysipelotrichaceae bacterium]